MAYWRVEYIDEHGFVKTELVTAETREQAKAKFSQADQVVRGVTKDPLGGIAALWREKKFPLLDQVLYLSTIASKINSGKTFGKAVKESVPYAQINISTGQIDACETPVDYLTLLRFDESAIQTVEAGYKVGKLPEALHRSGKTISERVAIKKEFAKTMRQGFLYTGLGVLSLFLTPLWGGAQFHDYLDVQKMPLKLNFFSHCILFLNVLYTQYFALLFAAFFAGYFFRKKLWDSVRRLPVIKNINEQAKVRRGLDFITSYQLLLSNGFTNPQSFNFLSMRSKGLTHRLYVEAEELLADGRPLAELFESDEWPALIHQNLKDFEDQTHEGRNIVLHNLSEALKMYFLNYSQKVSTLASNVGFVTLIFSILMFAIGFYFPIVTLGSSMKHI